MSDNYGRNPEPPEEQPTQRYDASPESGYAPNYDPNRPLSTEQPAFDQPTQVQPSFDQAPLDQTTQVQPGYTPPPYTNQPPYGGQLPDDAPTQVTPGYPPPPYTNQAPYTNQQNYAPDYSQPPQAYSQPSQTYSSVEVQQGGSSMGPIIAAVLVVLAVLGLGAYFLFFNKPSNNTVVVAATPTIAAAIQPTRAAIASPTAQQIATPASLASPTAGTINLEIPPVNATPMARTTPSPGPLLVDVDKGVATKEMIVYTSRGEIDIDLYPNAAPQSIAVYENMANSGQYDNHTFHRVEDWVLQGNDPRGDGTGGGDITTELNKIPYQIGSVGIARAQLDYSNDSQFFIVKTVDLQTYQNFTFLNTTVGPDGKPNGGYTLIGQVTKGMNLVDAMQIGDKIIAIRVRDKAGVSQTTPSSAATRTTVASSTEQQAAAQLLSDAAANMGQLTSYSYADSSVITGTSIVDTYALSGATDRSKQAGQYTLVHSSIGDTGSGGGLTNNVTIINTGGKQYYSTDGGKEWQLTYSDLLSSTDYYFKKVSSDIPSDASRFASGVTDLGTEGGGGGQLRHLSVDAATLYGDTAVGINGAVDIWLDPVAKTITELHLRGTASGSTAQIAYQGKWSKFNASPLNVTRPTNIVTPQATGEAATPAPGKSTVTIGVPIGGDTQLAQQLIDTAKKMQGFKSFHYADTALQGTTTYALDGDVDVAGDKVSFRYDSAGTIFQLIAIGQTEYYSADDGKTWQVNTNQPILGSVNYYLKQIWSDVAKLDAAKLAPFISQVAETDTKKLHISLPAEAIYGDNTGGIKGRMEFWLTGDKTVSQIYISGDYNGQAVTYHGMWTAFNKQVNITAPTNVITPTPLNGDDTGGNAGGLKLGDFTILKSFQASYSVVLTADKQVSTLNYTINVVRPDRMNLDVRGQAGDITSNSKEVVIGDDLYTSVAGSGWTKQAGGKKEYAKYEAMLNNELVGLPALSASFISAGEQTIAGEPCTHYIYSSGSLNLEIWVAKSDQQVRQLFDHAANTEVQITLSKLNGVGDINAPSGVK